MSEKTLGILGGIGPLATVYFMDMLVKMTDAKTDQEHISMVVFNHAAIPDRTEYIMDNTKPNPLPVMIEDARRLEQAGADLVVMPCNTAHFFYEEIQKNITVPMLNIIEETVKYSIESCPDLQKLGILATKGTIAAGGYQKMCERYGVECAIPDEKDQNDLMDIIYNQVKAGKKADIKKFLQIIENMKSEGCGAVVLGCTELSVINKDFNLNRDCIVDSMEVLARRSVEKCGKKLKI